MPTYTHPEALQRFVSRLPSHPYCTNDLSFGIKPQAAKKAIERAYIQPNRPNSLAYLLFDVDREDAAIRWYDVDLPKPTLIMRTRENGHAHLAYELKAPVYDRHGVNKPMRYAKAIQKAYTLKLGADSGYVGLIAKSPLSARWDVRVHNVAYDLSYLAEFVDLKPLPRRAANDDSVLGRNCNLFNVIRNRAYAVVHGCVDEQQLFIWVLNACLNYNAEAFCTPLGDAEVRSTAKGIAKWVWKRRSQIRTPRQRIMQLDENLPLAERQSLGGKYRAKLTAAKRRSETEEKIIRAIGELTAKGQRVTKAGIAKLTGTHRNTIDRYYSHLFKT
jgi:hypothetical protein